MLRHLAPRRFITRKFGAAAAVPTATFGNATRRSTTTSNNDASTPASAPPSDAAAPAADGAVPEAPAGEKPTAATTGNFCPESYNNGTAPAPSADGQQPTTAANAAAAATPSAAAAPSVTAAPITPSNEIDEGDYDNAKLSPERRYWLKTLLNAATTKFLNKNTEVAGVGAAAFPDSATASPAAPAADANASVLEDAIAAQKAAAEELQKAVERKHYVSAMTLPPLHVRPEGTAAAAGGSGSSVLGGPNMVKVGAASSGVSKTRIEQQLRRELRTSRPATSVDDLLNYNKKWAKTIGKIDPTYFKDLAKQQSPKFLWVGCADSRVPANQILGLAPGEVFVHRNIANVVSRSDLNCLSVIQYGVEHLRVEQLLVVGHYGCGGVTAAYKGLTLGLVDNWVSNIADIKHRYEVALERVPEEQRIDCLCDLNAITQALNVAESNVVQAHWRVFREEQEREYANITATVNTPAAAPAAAGGKPPKQALDIHGWCYSLEDGLIVPLVDFGPYDDVRGKAMMALERAVQRRVEQWEKSQRKPLIEGI